MKRSSSFWKLPRGSSHRRRDDAEFLPAALEILETPPSPIRASLIWLLCALAAGALLWSWIGTFDIVATSQGKIQPLGQGHPVSGDGQDPLGARRQWPAGEGRRPSRRPR
ncbi:hypothetical protein EMEDMD4_100086 [Sinorhizobium medicae]|uniref:Uncharacterized protein n=1 Tax=Sinorhizobium medicae TaxID=110321 RepID=A0A508WTW8_9HYPH|nr:hypothetical protein EMEDMD4_100086 [Sinorhizobium medicae]